MSPRGAVPKSQRGRPPLAGREIVLGVPGGIAAYKSPEIARRLMDAGAGVRAVLTPGAERFIAALTLAAITGRSASSDPFNLSDGKMPHLTLARADAILVAPCTADFLSALAAGRADMLLSSLILTTRAPVLIAPAMHEPMWTHPATRRNAETCRSLGYHFVGPDRGALASGDQGLGRLSDPGLIVAELAKLLSKKR